MQPAPVAAFVFRRPEHTRAMLASLRANPEAARTPVVVFCDGPRSKDDERAVAATRAAVRASELPALTVVEAERNRGLAASVIAGVTRMCAEYGRVIVLEDDLILAPTFLDYMNAALVRYRDDARVQSISGFMYPVPSPRDADAVFLPVISSWGWATWSRAWGQFDAAASGVEALRRSRSLRRRFDLGGAYPYHEMLEAQLRGERDSWAIRWYLTAFLRGGLTLFPARSLVENRGFGEGGTHCVSAVPRAALGPASAHRVERWPEPRVDEAVLRDVRRLLRRENGALARLLNRAYRRVRGAARARWW